MAAPERRDPCKGDENRRGINQQAPSRTQQQAIQAAEKRRSEVLPAVTRMKHPPEIKMIVNGMKNPDRNHSEYETKHPHASFLAPCGQSEKQGKQKNKHVHLGEHRQAEKQSGQRLGMAGTSSRVVEVQCASKQKKRRQRVREILL